MKSQHVPEDESRDPLPRSSRARKKSRVTNDQESTPKKSARSDSRPTEPTPAEHADELALLAEKIRAGHQSFFMHVRTSLEIARELGNNLLRVKGLVKRPGFKS
jgi:hypothetical protein